MENISFKTIDLENDQETTLKFREDSFRESFGDANRFFEADGQGHIRYLKWLREKIEKNPHYAVHVWVRDQIVGQVELGVLKGDPSIGYVNLYYLIPEMRGTGLSTQLDHYAVKVLSDLGFRKMRLSVSPSNLRAVKFYEKMGWRDVGPRPDHPEVSLMEKLI